MPRLSALAATEDRRRSTGESHQALHPLLGGRTEPLTIPAARHREQARLEAAVFLGVCKIGGRSAHPLGIVRLRPEEEQLTLRLLSEPYVIRHWAEALLPRAVEEDLSDPRDGVSGVPGLRWCREGGGIRLYRPGLPTRVVLTGFHPHWWERAVASMKNCYALFDEPDWAPLEHAAYAAWSASGMEPPDLLSPLLRRIRATAGPGSINATDTWWSMGRSFRLETTDGPPCPDLIRLLGDAPTGLGWEALEKTCTCLCDHTHGGCMVDFRDPATGLLVYYSNVKWGRTMDADRLRRVEAANRAAAFT
ncbi:hypothetical protein ACH4PU_32005 [Streptomyces sp. NPDC021100]|uniref:hypothetical protein n=1 Tax=Streptomyces sp. NPDC021100 TaxID=3365114 RepID=UPI0037B51FFC